MLKFEEWMINATAEDLPNDDLKFVADAAGMKTALIMVLLLPGTHLNIPKNALRLVKERYIINKYDGTRFSINKLAVECDLSQRYVYKIIEKHLNSCSKK